MSDPGAVGAHARILVRELRAEDAEAIGRLTLEAYDRYGRMEGPYRDHLGDPLRRLGRASTVLVAELDGEPAGTVTYVRPGDAEWEGRPEPAGDVGFRILAVAPSAEGHGVGRALIEACLERARGSGCYRLVVTSMSWMTRAHRLYERLGFVHQPDLDVTFPFGLGHTFVLDLREGATSRFAPPGPIPEVAPPATQVWRFS